MFRSEIEWGWNWVTDAVIFESEVIKLTEKFRCWDSVTQKKKCIYKNIQFKTNGIFFIKYKIGWNSLSKHAKRKKKGWKNKDELNNIDKIL